MEDTSHQRIPDQGLWWVAIALLVAIGAYMALASRPWGLAMGAALTAVVLLLNDKRISRSGNQGTAFTSLMLAVVAGLTLVLLHFVIGPAIRS
jgi:hypothetical protein